MPRLMGVDIPDSKRIEFALRYIHGIGPAKARQVVEDAKIEPGKKAGDLSAEELRAVLGAIQEKIRVEGDLRREVSTNIRRLIGIGCYRGLRHRRGLPVRGQRTSTNARTRKGVRRTVGAVRDKAARSAIKNA